MASTVNHNMDQGSDFAFSIFARDATGNAVDLSTGYAVNSQMRRHYSTQSYVSLTTQITGGTGYIFVSLGATATAGISPGRYFYDVELSSLDGGSVQRLVEGIVTVHPEVTRI